MIIVPGYLVSDFKAAYLKKATSLNIEPNTEIVKFFDSSNTLPSQLKLHGASIDARALSPLLPFLSPQFYDNTIFELSLSKTLSDDATVFNLSKVESLIPRLQKLDLSNTSITSTAVLTLLHCLGDASKCRVPSLSFLDLSFTRIDDRCLVDLVSLSKACPSLSHLKLDGNDFCFSDDSAFKAPADQGIIGLEFLLNARSFSGEVCPL